MSDTDPAQVNYSGDSTAPAKTLGFRFVLNVWDKYLQTKR